MPDSSSLIGQTVSHYRIFEKLGGGGMGVVYKAQDTRLDRFVALKFLPEDLAHDRQALERFRREAKAASALNHPNICTIYDIGEQEGKAFIAMEYLEGEALSARIEKGPLPISESVQIAIRVASALSTAHKKGIIHRDLKPGNIMLTATGTKLLDFGLAKYMQPAAVTDETATMLTGELQVVGTLPYMSPEQLQGMEVDARVDIFGFGAVLYEMLTGTRAFQRKSSSETIIAVGREDPRPVREVVKEVPEKLEKIVQRCLRKRAAERYGSVAEIERELKEWWAEAEEPASGINLKVLLRKSRRPRVAVPLALVSLLAFGAGAWSVHHTLKVRWARQEALPKIAELTEKEKTGEAFALAVQAQRYIPKDPILEKFWDDISWSAEIRSTPPGAAVYRKDYAAPDRAWEFIGVTPIPERKFPAVDSKWKYELKGYVTVERATFPDGNLSITMDEEGKAPAGMVKVRLSTPDSKTSPVKIIGIPGYTDAPEVPLGDYWIDKYEVTNAEFKRLVDQGGYQKQEYWKEKFEKDGRVLSWAEAMKLFVDKTARPGPAEWVQGEYPVGQEDYPVTGLSWYEAAAYAAFVGKALPTIYHWSLAASPWGGSSILPASNFAGRGTSARGTYLGMSRYGAYDLAGNVKEWILNEDRSGKRLILGGAWNEPSYAFFVADARMAFARDANFGFRCAKYELSGESDKAANAITIKVRDYRSETPASHQAVEAYKEFYSYDKTPLHATVDRRQETGDWRVEKVSYDAAYGKERIIAYLYLPKRASPPFQTVVYFPGSGAVYEKSSEGGVQVGSYDFIVKSGRAVLAPVYKSTYERHDGYTPGRKDTTDYRDHVVLWYKDLARSVDYLETRTDIDYTKIAYEGASWGAAMGALFPALETRFRALVLVCPGFYVQTRLPEADPFNFAPYVKAPVLMLNGRFDYLFPIDSSQEPMFRILGTPKEQKRWVVYDTGHDIPRTEQIKETLDWLDKYLGSVK